MPPFPSRPEEAWLLQPARKEERRGLIKKLSPVRPSVRKEKKGKKFGLCRTNPLDFSEKDRKRKKGGPSPSLTQMHEGTCHDGYNSVPGTFFTLPAPKKEKLVFRKERKILTHPPPRRRKGGEVLLSNPWKNLEWY